MTAVVRATVGGSCPPVNQEHVNGVEANGGPNLLSENTSIFLSEYIVELHHKGI